jgi:hypothetical protein
MAEPSEGAPLLTDKAAAAQTSLTDGADFVFSGSIGVAPPGPAAVPTDDAAPGPLAAVEADHGEVDRRDPLASPDALAFSPDAGLPPVRLAQATPAALSPTPVGKVEKVSGSATVLRNGTPVALHLGTPILKGDIIQTSSASSVTIKFLDGTVFLLSADSRVGVDEMAYSAGSASNSVLFNLVQGAMGLFAGKAAKTGDFAVETPVATLGIRGTAIRVEVLAANGATKFSLMKQPNGVEGSFLIYERTNPGHVLATVSDSRSSVLVMGLSTTDVSATTTPKTPDELRAEGSLVRLIFQYVDDHPLRRGSGESGPDLFIPAADVIRTPEAPERVAFQLVTIKSEGPLQRPAERPNLPEDVLRFTASATEDGPAVSLDALRGFKTAKIIAPAHLPPGVSFDRATETFRLDPSDPAYQHIAVGETETVSVAYRLTDGTNTAPAVASWTVQGRNDPPVAQDDRLSAGATGVQLLPVLSNDRDIDRDPLKVVSVAQPVEGALRIDSAGHLLFDPGRDFAALSAGQTATISFSYTMADPSGATDTASATVTVHGTGTFRSPLVTDTEFATLPQSGQTVKVALTAPSRTTTPQAEVDLSVAFGKVVQPHLNLIYLVDVSASVDDPFGGAPVGDRNGDGHANTILDAEIANLVSLTNRVRSLGFSSGDVTLTLIPYNSSADPAAGGGAGAAAVVLPLGSTGDATLSNALRQLTAAGGTDLEHALQAAAGRLKTLDPSGVETNLVYLLSDGAGLGNAHATFLNEESALPNAMGLKGASGGGPTLTEQDGAIVDMPYSLDSDASTYLALVNPEVAQQSVRYSALLADGSSVLVHQGSPESFTLADMAAASRQLGTSRFIVRFEDFGGPIDFNDFVAQVDLGRAPAPVPNVTDEVALLTQAFRTQISAVGFGPAADLTALDAIDTTGGAERALTANALDVSLVGVPVPPGRIVSVDLTVNGRPVAGLGPEDFVVNGSTLLLKVNAADLSRFVGETNDIVASVTLTGGVTVITSLPVHGALPRSTDLDF